MLSELAVIGGVMSVVVGLLEISHRLEGSAPKPVNGTGAVREAMRGIEGNAVRAEYRRSGIEPSVAGRRPLGFGL
jgi:hypothetical protein